MDSLFGEDSQGHLDHVDRMLGLALFLPGQVKPVPKGEDPTKQLGEVYEQLAPYFSDSWGLQRFLNRYRRPRTEFLPHDPCLQLRAWAGGSDHSAQRRALIELLWEVRSGVLLSLTRFVEPSRKPISESPTVPGEKPPLRRTWVQLTDREQAILHELAKRRLAAKELAEVLKANEDSLRHTLAALGNEGIIQNVRGAGYRIATPPPGSPDAVTLAVPRPSDSM